MQSLSTLVRGGAIAALAFLAAGIGTTTAGSLTSVYTKTDGPDCQTIRKPGADEENGGYALWTCGSVGGMAAIFADADARQMVGYTRARDQYSEADVQELDYRTLGPFNTFHKVMEWRVDKSGAESVPYATILRFFTSVTKDDGTPYNGQVLVVTRLGPEGACPVAYVDARANKNANALATEAADTIARSVTCNGSDPQTVGRKTELSGF